MKISKILSLEFANMLLRTIQLLPPAKRVNISSSCKEFKKLIGE